MWGFSDEILWIMYGTNALVAFVCIGVIARALWIPSDMRRRCCCGGCGYAITDAASGRCPECGGLFTKVGITTPALAIRLRGPLGWALLAWTVLFGLIGGHGMMYMQQQAAMAAMTATVTGFSAAASTKMQTTRDMDFAPNEWFDKGEASTTNLKFRFDANLSYIQDAGTVESATAKIGLRLSGANAPATVELNRDADSQTYTLKGPGGAVVSKGNLDSLNAATIQAWFDAAGINKTDPAIAVSRRDALLVAKAATNDPESLDGVLGFRGATEAGALRAGGGSGGSRSIGPTASIAIGGGGVSPLDPTWSKGMIIAVALFASLYLLGVALITWRHRRLLA